MVKVVGLGAGGHARVVIDILQQSGDFEIVGLLSPDPLDVGKEVSGIPVIGCDDILEKIHNDGIRHAFIGIGSVRAPHLRRQVFERAKDVGFAIISVIHSNATIASSVTMGEGVAVMPGAIIGPDTNVGDNVIVNTGAIVEHDCQLGNHVHISTGTRIAGGVAIGECCHIGIGATVIQCLNIGQGAVVGAGAVVIKDVPADVVVVGVPARVTGNAASSE